MQRFFDQRQDKEREVSMVLADIEEYVKPLSKAEKEQLIRDIQRMLFDEMVAEHGEEMLREMIDPNVEYEITTPTISPDDSGAQAAYQLQWFMEENEHVV
jgi:hypothetical protein